MEKLLTRFILSEFWSFCSRKLHKFPPEYRIARPSDWVNFENCTGFQADRRLSEMDRRFSPNRRGVSAEYHNLWCLLSWVGRACELSSCAGSNGSQGKPALPN